MFSYLYAMVPPMLYRKEGIELKYHLLTPVVYSSIL